ncbi:MAG: flagellar export chaperone FliS [Shewanella sp.]|uniref:flagellar export chaperone FliS n=2 Tax=Shewanella sp. TaxID=50422 RepID=UPI003F2CF3F0
MRGSLQSYRKVSLESQLADASPHKITQMLFAGALERLAQTRAAIEQGNMANKGVLIGKAIGIIQGLRNGLVMDQGGELAKNLNDLYEFVLRRLGEANINNDPAALDDAATILRELKEAWDAIPADKHHITAQNPSA